MIIGVSDVDKSSIPASRSGCRLREECHEISLYHCYRNFNPATEAGIVKLGDACTFHDWLTEDWFLVYDDCVTIGRSEYKLLRMMFK